MAETQDNTETTEKAHLLPRGVREFLGWALVVALSVGSWLLVMQYHNVKSQLLAVSFDVAHFVLVFGVYRLLESNFALSRFMGLRVYSNSSPNARALGLTLLGFIWLLIHASPSAAPNEDKEKKAAEPRDTTREVIETVVFVVVLVLLLQLFVAQAFVIPTGSMATTLLGNHKAVTCEKCGFEFMHNGTTSGGKPPSEAYVCPNCRYKGALAVREDPDGGDRVIVLKPAYHVSKPQRFQVPVFKFPKEPLDIEWERQNYIKRLVGYGGETIAIHRGNLYATTSLEYEPNTTLDAWRKSNTYAKFFGVAELREHGFKIPHRPPSVMLEMRRIVNDNERQPAEFAGKIPPRWWAEDGTWPKDQGGWSVDNEDTPKVFSHDGDETDWIRYQHLVPSAPYGFGHWDGPPRPGEFKPDLVRNFLGYNYHTEAGYMNANTRDWVGDLYVECRANVKNDSAEVTLEVSEGPDRFQAVFNVAEGKCTLRRVPLEGDAVELATAESPMDSAGEYDLRLANVDNRLTVWVDSKVLEFGEGADYDGLVEMTRFEDDDTEKEGWVRANDIERPARVGAKGSVAVDHLSVWRDTFYTPYSEGENAFFVQPGHYFCLGDNSSASLDGRDWGLVPERLLLGRALLVYYPVSRIGLIE